MVRREPWPGLIWVDAASTPKAVLGEVGFLKNSFFFLPNIDDVGKVGKIYWGESQKFPHSAHLFGVSAAFHFLKCYIWITYVFLLQLCG